MKTVLFNELYEILKKVRTTRDAQLLLEDFFTPAERRDLVMRIKLVKLLMKGLPHREISKKLKVSIAVVTRGSHALKKSRGGFRKFLKSPV